MREDFWQFSPTHKLVLATNHKPRIKGSDHSIWRRIRLVPFNERFDGDRRDKLLPEKLAAERQGILAWLVRGAVDWHSNGLREAEAVTAATREYRDAEDTLGAFIDECCLIGPHFKVKAGNLIAHYTEWAKANSESPMGNRRFGEEMANRGFHKMQSGTRWYTGVGLRED